MSAAVYTVSTAKYFGDQVVSVNDQDGLPLAKAVSVLADEVESLNRLGLDGTVHLLEKGVDEFGFTSRRNVGSKASRLAEKRLRAFALRRTAEPEAPRSDPWAGTFGVDPDAADHVVVAPANYGKRRT